MKFDRQDVLFLLGVCALLSGIAAWSLPSAAIVLGLMCLAAVLLIERTKHTKKG